jgi:hypothetical protein
MFARYTFFEIATQKGYLMAVMHDLLPSHWVRQVIEGDGGNEFLLSAFRNLHDTEPTWHLGISGRLVTESTQMWQERARREAIDAWEKFAKAEAERVAALKAAQIPALAAAKEAEARAAKIADRVAAAALLGASAAALAPDETEASTPPVAAPAAKKGKKSLR